MVRVEHRHVDGSGVSGSPSTESFEVEAQRDMQHLLRRRTPGDADVGEPASDAELRATGPEHRPFDCRREQPVALDQRGREPETLGRVGEEDHVGTRE